MVVKKIFLIFLKKQRNKHAYLQRLEQVDSEMLFNLESANSLKQSTVMSHNVSCHLCSVMDIKGLPLFGHNKPPFFKQISITK